MIGLIFNPDKEIHTLIKELPSPKWSREFNMVYLVNNKSNLQMIFKKFKGIAWINMRDFSDKTADTINIDNKFVILTINRDQFRIFIKLPERKKAEWTDKLTSFEQSFYIRKYDLWAIKGGNDNYLNIKRYFENAGYIVIVNNKQKSLKNKNYKKQKWYHNRPIYELVMQEYKKTLIIKRASNSTKKTYSSLFKRFLVYFYGKDIKNILVSKITDYMLWEIEKNAISPTMQNQIINAIKYYYEKTLDRARTVYNLPRPKKEQKVPIVLNIKELNSFFSDIKNLKHKCIMVLLFSSGMRRNELINLKPNDIDFGRKTVLIKKGKGSKGRISIIRIFL